MLGIKPALKIALRLAFKATIEVEIRALQSQARQFGHPLECLQSLWKQHRIRFIDWSYRKRRQHIAVVVNDGDDLCTLLVFVAGVANTITAFLGHGIGAIAMQDTQIELLMVGQMTHTGDEGVLK